MEYDVGTAMPSCMKVDDGDVGERIDKFLSEKISDASRERIKQSILDGLVHVNGIVVPPKYVLKLGDVVDFQISQQKVINLRPHDAAIDILFEDDDILLVNKPSGVVVHPGNGETWPTLVEMVLSHCHLSALGGESRPGVVHRIDKETSGVVIFAKTDIAYLRLIKMFEHREIKKQYRAIVCGTFDKLFGEISAPISRSRANRTKMAVVDGGRQAITQWDVLSRFFGKFSYMNIKILTGRTHQIRVHMSHIRHPIAGDTVYGYNKNFSKKIEFPRVMLHAHEVAFNHPISGKLLTVRAPLPDDFENVLGKLASIQSAV